MAKIIIAIVAKQPAICICQTELLLVKKSIIAPEMAQINLISSAISFSIFYTSKL